MNRQDRQGARTPADLERRYNFGRSFAEVLGIAEDAQIHALNAEETANALKLEVSTLSLLVGDTDSGLVAEIEAKLDKDKLVSQFNLAANEITITSDNFKLTADGEIISRKGAIGGWNIGSDSLYGESLIQYGDAERITYRTELNTTTEDNDIIYGVRAVVETLDVAEWIVSDVFYPVSIDSKGRFVTRNATNTRFLDLSAGEIFLQGDRSFHHDIYLSFLLLKFSSGDRIYGLYANGQYDDTDTTGTFPIIWHGISVKEITEEGD